MGLGRFYNWDDLNQARRRSPFSAAMPPSNSFPAGDPVGQNVYLNDIPFSVVGVMAKKKQDSSYDGWDVNKDVHSLLRR